ncbi:MAG: agmatinase [Thermodesulfobacteriota bacterium]
MRSVSFGNLCEADTSYESSKVVLLPLPYEASTTFLKGTAVGPESLLEASAALEFYDEELDWEPFRVGIHTSDAPRVNAASPVESLNAMEEAAWRHFSNGKFLIGLGGEHTVSLALVRAALRVYPALTVVQLDAHADLRDRYEGSPYNHACVMRRVRELCPAVQMGIRALDLEEMRLVRVHRWPLFLDLDRLKDPSWLDQALDGLGGPVYLTLDLDVMDPALMPGVGTPEPGGFGWYDILEVLRRLFSEKEVVGADVVELCPRPGLESSCFIAAKLVYKIIGYRFYPNAHPA